MTTSLRWKKTVQATYTTIPLGLYLPSCFLFILPLAFLLYLLFLFLCRTPFLLTAFSVLMIYILRALATFFSSITPSNFRVGNRPFNLALDRKFQVKSVGGIHDSALKCLIAIDGSSRSGVSVVNAQMKVNFFVDHRPEWHGCRCTSNEWSRRSRSTSLGESRSSISLIDRSDRW